MNAEQARFNMIEQQIRPWGVFDPGLLDALHDVPRENFVPQAHRDLAFAEVQLPIGHDQVMIRPLVEAKLIQSLTLTPSDTVLEIGTGSGYMSAIMSYLCARVDTVEIFPDFIDSARTRLQEHDIRNIRCHEGDGALGWTGGEEYYDAIILTGSVPAIPETYKTRLNMGGRLVAVVGNLPATECQLLTRLDDHSWQTSSVFDVEIPRLLNVELAEVFKF